MALSGLKKQKLEKVAQAEPEDQTDGSENDSDGETAGNAGWADSIAKVLNTTKPKTKKTLVLSRAKKIKLGGSKSKSSEDCGFELEGVPEIKEVKPNKTELDEKAKLRKNQQLALRVRPSWKDLERERTLRKLATRGVVQLFNAVRIQQKDLKHQLEEAGPLDSRKEAIMNNINKRKFLDVLMSGNRAKSEAIDNPIKNEHKYNSDSSEEGDAAGKKKVEWNVFRDDFMTNKKIKHWDEENSDNNSQNEEDDSDDDEE